jgi:hypothetical protein
VRVEEPAAEEADHGPNRPAEEEAASYAKSAKGAGAAKSAAGPSSKLRSRTGDEKRSSDDGLGLDAYAPKKAAPKASSNDAPRVEAERSALEQKADRESGQKSTEFAPAPPPSPAAAPTPPAKPFPSKVETKGGAPLEEAVSSEGAVAPRKENQDKSVDWAQKSLNDGIAATRRGAYAQAVSLLAPVVSQGPESTRQSARLWLARSLRGQDKCAEALRYYGPLVQQPSASGDVLSEAADCYERTGEPAQAGKLRSRLGAQE